ncbi:hypothetical protein CEXT_200851 [Caerostris extrusa]|uniref:Secreted protein n=1 Tax=Caerostris extrusa TaxID=172846 RepID=A0AAV4XHH3_CAEEX|nr:hypothetical protein CEXT_200851 [Caerostris extrusa]
MFGTPFARSRNFCPRACAITQLMFYLQSAVPPTSGCSCCIDRTAYVVKIDFGVEFSRTLCRAPFLRKEYGRGKHSNELLIIASPE